MFKIGERFVPYKIFKGIFIPNALVAYPHISSTAKILWGKLSQHAGEDGLCFPSHKKLAEKIGVSKGQVARVLRELVKQGFIAREAPSLAEKGKHQTTRYFFLWHQCFENSRPSSKNGSRPSSKNGSRPSSKNGSRPSSKNGSSLLAKTIDKKVKIKEILLKERLHQPLKAKAIQLLNGYEKFIVERPKFLVERFSAAGFEPVRIWAALMSARGKKNPAAYFIYLLTTRGIDFPDHILAEAKGKMQQTAGPERLADLVSDIAEKRTAK